VKTKTVFGLALALVLFLLGGLFMNQVVNAQVKMIPYPMPSPANRIAWDYDSGWIDLPSGDKTTFSHNLGGDPGEYFVSMTGKHPSSGMVHQAHYGLEVREPNTILGSKWILLTSTTITVERGHSDSNIGDEAWDQVRIRILANQ